MIKSYKLLPFTEIRLRSTSILMKLLFIQVCLLMLVSCRQRTTSAEHQSRNYEPFYRPEEFTDGVKTITMTLGDSISSAPSELTKNRYGQFFYGRAQYYVVENPTNELMDTKVLRTILYYFDSKLYRVQYIIANDVSHKLINTLPNFSIVTFNHESRSILHNEPPVLRLSNKSLMLNPGLTDYELRWRGEETIVKWRCAKSRNYFEYSEVNADYAEKFYELEKYEYDMETQQQ
jgi:hypothetical protein